MCCIYACCFFLASLELFVVDVNGRKKTEYEGDGRNTHCTIVQQQVKCKRKFNTMVYPPSCVFITSIDAHSNQSKRFSRFYFLSSFHSVRCACCVVPCMENCPLHHTHTSDPEYGEMHKLVKKSRRVQQPKRHNCVGCTRKTMIFKSREQQQHTKKNTRNKCKHSKYHEEWRRARAHAHAHAHKRAHTKCTSNNNNGNDKNVKNVNALVAYTKRTENFLKTTTTTTTTSVLIPLHILIISWTKTIFHLGIHINFVNDVLQASLVFPFLALARSVPLVPSLVCHRFCVCVLCT